MNTVKSNKTCTQAKKKKLEESVIDFLNMKPTLERLLYPVSLQWIKLIFLLPAGINDSSIVNLYPSGYVFIHSIIKKYNNIR